MDTHKERSKIGKRIKELRLKKGLSQDLVSKKANLSFQTISKIESGSTSSPTIDTVIKIAKVLDISLMPGEMALENGLIDRIGDYYDAQTYLNESIGEKAGICW